MIEDKILINKSLKFLKKREEREMEKQKQEVAGEVSRSQLQTNIKLSLEKPNYIPFARRSKD